MLGAKHCGLFYYIQNSHSCSCGGVGEVTINATSLIFLAFMVAAISASAPAGDLRLISKGWIVQCIFCKKDAHGYNTSPLAIGALKVAPTAHAREFFNRMFGASPKLLCIWHDLPSLAWRRVSGNSIHVRAARTCARCPRLGRRGGACTRSTCAATQMVGLRARESYSRVLPAFNFWAISKNTPVSKRPDTGEKLAVVSCVQS
jgi:hypothetical protein